MLKCHYPSEANWSWAFFSSFCAVARALFMEISSIHRSASAWLFRSTKLVVSSNASVPVSKNSASWHDSYLESRAENVWYRRILHFPGRQHPPSSSRHRHKQVHRRLELQPKHLSVNHNRRYKTKSAVSVVRPEPQATAIRNVPFSLPITIYNPLWQIWMTCHT